jgi:hypothetical protein
MNRPTALLCLLAAAGSAHAVDLRFPMNDGVHAYVGSGFDNAPISDHGGRLPLDSYVKPHQLYGLDFHPQEADVEIIAPCDGKVVWKGSDALIYHFEEDGRTMAMVLAHFEESEPTFAALHRNSVIHKGEKLGERRLYDNGTRYEWIHMSLEYWIDNNNRIPIPFMDGYQVRVHGTETQPLTFGDFRIDGRAWEPHYDNSGRREEYNFHVSSTLFTQGGSNQPATASPARNVQTGRWITRIYGIRRNGHGYHHYGAPSYYRVQLRDQNAVVDREGGDIDGNGEITPEEWEYAQDWPPKTLVMHANGDDITRFRAIMEGKFNFADSGNYPFRVEYSNQVLTYIDGRLIAALSDADPDDLPPGAEYTADQSVRTLRATLPITAGNHSLTLIYSMVKPPEGVSPRARFLFDWSAPGGGDCAPEEFEAHYHRTPYFDDPFHEVSCETTIDHDWGSGNPFTLPPRPSDHFSATWEGSFDFFGGGDYIFTGRIAEYDYLRVRVDGDTLLENLLPSPFGSESGARATLSAGMHSIAVEYVDLIGDADIQVEWQPAANAVGCVTGLLLEYGWNPVQYPFDLYIWRRERMDWEYFTTLDPALDGSFCTLLEPYADYWMHYTIPPGGYPRDCDGYLSVSRVGGGDCALPDQCEDLGVLDFYCDS